MASAWPPGFPKKALVPGRVDSFRSFDGRKISGVLYAPTCRGGAGLKAALWLHGGPQGEAEQDYIPLAQYLAAKGYVVYAPNYRGSTGFGKSFARLSARRHGEGDLKDIVAAKGHLVGTGLADQDMVAVMGGSFGGYLTLAAITTDPAAFDAAVDLFGIANWERVLRSIPKSWASRRVALTTEIGDPDQDNGAYLRSISPIFKADRIRVPLFIMQGVNDPRVKPIESNEIAAAARRAGVPVEYLLLNDEGHNWPNHKSNEIHALTEIGAFLDRSLSTRPGQAPPVSDRERRPEPVVRRAGVPTAATAAHGLQGSG